MKDHDWDFISLQQVSGDSGKSDTYSNLQNLIDWIRERANEEAKFVWNMTWAYDKNSTHEAFAGYGSDQETMYRAIAETTKNVVYDMEDISMIIPTGTAIQNYRNVHGDVLSRDGHHLNDFGRYVAGLAFFKALTGAEIGGLDYLIEGDYDTVDRCYAIDAAINATREFYSVTDSDFVPEIYTVTYMSGEDKIHTERVAKGFFALYSELLPMKNINNAVGIFSGWARENGEAADFTALDSDTTVYAVYSKANTVSKDWLFGQKSANIGTVLTSDETYVPVSGVEINSVTFAVSRLGICRFQNDRHRHLQ